MNTSSSYDAAVVGAGILGLAHAYHLARRGLNVIVFDRSARAQGASVRNFGMLWPIGQPSGQLYDMARESREYWLSILREAGLWYDRCGSLHLAYRADEAQVLREIAEIGPGRGVQCEFVSDTVAMSLANGIRLTGLVGALWSPIEICVDPREVIARLPSFLTERYGVVFEFDCAVTGYDNHRVRSGNRSWDAGNLYVCSGDDLRTLYPDIYAESGLVRCKLQMMRTSPLHGTRIGPMLAAGLTLQHYRIFSEAPSLPALKRRFAEEMPEYNRWGIHGLVSQNEAGELTLGDSHEYAFEIDPFDKSEVDHLVLRYLNTFLNLDGVEIATRWNGTYVKHLERPYYVERPEANVTLVTGIGGAGMTLSFGLAAQVVAADLDELTSLVATNGMEPLAETKSDGARRAVRSVRARVRR